MTHWVTQGTHMSSPHTKSTFQGYVYAVTLSLPSATLRVRTLSSLSAFLQEAGAHLHLIPQDERECARVGLHSMWQVQAVWTATVDRQVETWDAGGSVTSFRLVGSTKRCIRQQHGNEEQWAPSIHGTLSPAPHTWLMNQDWTTAADVLTWHKRARVYDIHDTCAYEKRIQVTNLVHSVCVSGVRNKTGPKSHSTPWQHWRTKFQS